MHRHVLGLVACLAGFLQSPAGAARMTIPGPVPAVLLRIVDGDNIVVRARIWPGHEVTTSVRIRGIDTPELEGRCERERLSARAARTALARFLGTGDVALSVISGDKYHGRVLADVASAAGDDAAVHMLVSGHAAPYAGRKRKRDWCAGTGPHPAPLR